MTAVHWRERNILVLSLEDAAPAIQLADSEGERMRTDHHNDDDMEVETLKSRASFFAFDKHDLLE